MKIIGATDNRSLYHEGDRTMVGAWVRLSRQCRVFALTVTRDVSVAMRPIAERINGR